MATAATVIQSFESYEWNTQMYGVLSLASGLAVSIRNKGNVLRLAFALNKTNRHLTSMFDKVHLAMEGKIPPDPNREPVTAEKLRVAADNLIQLHQTLQYVFDSCKRVGLLNNSLTAGALQKIRMHEESLLDLIDWFELTSEPARLEEIFNRAKREKEHGDVFDLK